MDSCAIAEALLSSSRPASEVLNGLFELKKIGGFSFLTPTERRARDRRRAAKRREDPQAARARRMSFKRNRTKILQGRRRFMASASGKRLMKTLGRRRAMTNWVQDYAPGMISLPESLLDLTPFEELQVIASAVLKSPTQRESVSSFLEGLAKLVADYPDLVDEAEVRSLYDDVADFLQERMAASEVGAPVDLYQVA